MRQPLRDVPGREAAVNRLVDLSGYVEADAEQDATLAGIEVSVGLVNGGDQEIPVLNSFAMLQFLLRDERGLPLRLPTKPSPLLVHTRGGEDWSIGGPIAVVNVHKDDQPQALDSLNERVLSIGAGTAYRVVFRIDRLRQEPGNSGESADASRFVEAPLPAGAYRLRCTMTVIDAERTEESRILKSDEIEVRVGVPAR